MTTTSACLSSLCCRPSRLRAAWPLLVAASLGVLSPLLQDTAWAQTPAPYGAQYGAAIDPPGRVARLNLVEGAVSFEPADTAGTAGADAWTAAQLNRPLTSGDRLWTGPGARSELHIGSTALRMSEQTSLDFVTLDDDAVQLRLAQGNVQLRVRTLFEGQRMELNTPNLAFVITQPGNYRLDVDPTRNTTRVVVLSGAGVMYGDGGETVSLGSQQQASFTGTQLTPAGPGATMQDSFDAWAADRDRLEDQSVSARYIPRETLGYQQLDRYGDWRQDATYGAVWLPRAVPLNWAPYRMGHWSWIAPWGWTWIDDAPWGFAPCHYGRWARIGPRWAWVPGRLAARPVYAPALVAFVGGHSGGVNWNIAIGSGSPPRPGLGWFPLAPGEAFHPAFRASPRYVNRVNHNIVVHDTGNRPHFYRYQRQPDAVTAVSREDFSRGRPVRSNLAPLSAADLSRAQVLTGGGAEGAANRSALPQRPDFRERPRPAVAAALPPAALMAAQPVVRSRDERRDDRRDDRRDARKDERPEDRGGAPRAQTPVVPSLPPTAALPSALFPAVKPGPATTPQDRPAIDAENRARREQQQLQRDQERQQSALTRQQEAQRRQAEESLGQRALREQAQKNSTLPPPTSARPVDQDARAAAERSAVEQARQQEQQRRQNDEQAGQRAMREQAQRQQAQHQMEQQREQARQMQEQQRQQQAVQQQRAQQDQHRRNEELLGQRALREQAQRQQEQQRQQQAQQQRVQQDQQRQQQEQRRQQAEEKQHARQTDAARNRELRPEGGPNRHKEP